MAGLATRSSAASPHPARATRSMHYYPAAAVLSLAAMGDMNNVIGPVAAFLAPPECPLGCMNWTDALNDSERAASFADPALWAHVLGSFTGRFGLDDGISARAFRNSRASEQHANHP